MILNYKNASTVQTSEERLPGLKQIGMMVFLPSLE